ncbi:MAG: hypothetical protein AW10_03974 [Candidatus Accumulibacter appositus]|uniref:Uncharacterized protein n=1 Tax=Candidatus Accumulibacter appositus TaxID=1454003 RepID=A0A011N3N9_9PROT|nr:MAG: hypothetical protein AW10_03974 [Candidatus Accumulibacter appositus]
MSLSQRIVHFIGSLLPLYIEDEVNGVWCARSLNDGTLICPVEEVEEYEDGFVTVHWQGDPARQTLVQAVFMASLAVAKYVELHHLAEKAKGTRDEMEHLANHFAIKTGASLSFDLPDSGLPELMVKAVGKVGEAAVIEVLKKQVGL